MHQPLSVSPEQVERIEARLDHLEQRNEEMDTIIAGLLVIMAEELGVKIEVIEPRFN